MDCSPPGSSVHRILQARIQEWVLVPSSRGSSWPRNQTCISFPALAGRFFTTSATWEALYVDYIRWIILLTYRLKWNVSNLNSPVSIFNVPPRPFPRWCSCKESACQCRTWKRHRFPPWVGKIPYRREWQLTPVFLPGKFHEQRSLRNCSPWGCKESDTTEHTHTHTHTHRHTHTLELFKLHVRLTVYLLDSDILKWLWEQIDKFNSVDIWRLYLYVQLD